MADETRAIGRPLRRVEDPRLLRGQGRYVDDLAPPGVVHLALLRCPHAHARVERLDLAPALATPGVVAVLTGAETAGLGPMPVMRVVPDMRVPPHPILASGVVHAAGVPVAAVAAESPYVAHDALERVGVEWEPLAPLVDAAAALDPDALPLFAGPGGNLALHHRWVTGGLPERDAPAARLRVEQPRLAGVPLESRATLAVWDAATDELTVWTSTQAPFRVRSELATILGLPESRVRVIAPDVGGGFGLKTAPYREDVLVALLARRLGRPVKWVATRREDLLTTNHARGSVAEGELLVDGDGHLRGVRGRIVYGLGTSLVNSAGVSPWNHGRLLPGAYRIPACDIEIRGALTTTAPNGAYRGAGRPEATFLIERLVDAAARRVGLDPVELRRRNFVPPEAFPFRTATGQVYDSGAYERALDEALALADHPGLLRWRAEARAGGEVAGVGVACYVEPAALGWESGLVRVERTGAVTAVTGSSAHGQGHETTFAQVVADFLGVSPSDVLVRHGDTHGAPVGMGTFGSRSTALGGGALAQAAGTVRDKARRVAARLLEAAPEDVVQADGAFGVVGAPDRRVTWRQVALAAYTPGGAPPGEPPGLEDTVYFQGDGEVWSFGTVVAAVRIERETGRLEILRLAWVDDAGTLVNPLLVEGQLHGSLAQALGQALFEQVVYDEAGQLLTATLMDYAVPRAADVVRPRLGKTVTPSPRNPIGAKGVGEAGCIGVPPAIVNAAVDALSPFGVTTVDMPLTPEKLWRLLPRTLR